MLGRLSLLRIGLFFPITLCRDDLSSASMSLLALTSSVLLALTTLVSAMAQNKAAIIRDKFREKLWSKPRS